MGLTVGELLEKYAKDLRLELVAGRKGLNRSIQVVEINRPGLALAGYFTEFRSERIQVLGRGEIGFTNFLESSLRKKRFKKVIGYKNIPALVCSRGLQPHEDIKMLCNSVGVPLLLSYLDTANFIGELTVILEENLSPTITMHGVLANVYGLGVLITGDSGIGKSECAMELLKRGHMLIADDVVQVQRRSGGILVGFGQEVIRHHMEVRGLGIVDVRSIFGVGAILDRSRIELTIHLEMWDSKKEYDRLGLEEKTTQILDADLPYLIIPVHPGRNLAVLVEVAALNQRLRYKGYHTAQILNERLIRIMSKPKDENKKKH